MELPVQVPHRNMEPSDAVTARIEAEAAKLHVFFPRIPGCRVVVQAPHRHHKGSVLFHIRTKLGVPGTELLFSHQPTPVSVPGRSDRGLVALGLKRNGFNE